MRLKMPCLKPRLPRLTRMIFSLLLSVLAIAASADTGQQEDQALFWSIQKGGQPVGYLLGTIHSEDPRVLEFSEEFLSKLRSSEVFAMELVPDVPTLERLTGYMHLPSGQSLESVIGPDRYRALETAISAYRVPPESLQRMKPWAVVMTLSTPPPETGFFMDLSLSLRAGGNGLEVVGLETLEQQLSFLEDMPLSMQLSLLDQAIAESGQVTKVHAQMVDAYLENNLVSLQALSNQQFETVGKDISDYFIESGIHARNHRMAETLLHQLDKKTVFVAVGALHLPGEQGLLYLLRQHGFELNPLAMPLIGSAPSAEARHSP